MNLTTIVNEACKALDIAPVYAMLREGNVVLDGQRNYPIMVWPFDESITLNREGVVEIQRTVELYFAFNYGDVDGDMAALMPLIDEAVQLVSDFVAHIELAGVECSVGTMRPTVSRFDALEAGVSAPISFTYRNCPSCSGD